MNELRRSIYLQAMAVDAYVSRRQLPGAAATRRVAIVPELPAPPARAIAKQAAGISPPRQLSRAPAVPMPRLETAEAAAPVAVAERAPGRSAELRFSLAAITCGGWLWLEELDGEPFSAEQMQLVQAMAEAVARLPGCGGSEQGAVPAQSTRFDWPMHANLQLDQGQDAARSSVAAFIQRRLEQQECRGLVLLGRGSETRVPLDQLDCPRLARSPGTADMLRDPLLKKQAWHDLRALARPL